MSDWGFYGRQVELHQLAEIFSRRRWFFVKIMGRRRIGKTTLIRQALDKAAHDQVLYVQIPDSSPPGVMSAVGDAMEVFGIGSDRFRPPTSLGEFAVLIAALVRDGYIVVLDEFQYFNREKLGEFTSLLQSQIDALNRIANEVVGGLVVLGSIHTEMAALLEDRHAPLFARITHDIELGHLDIGSVLEILQAHADTSRARLLFTWCLFEGVPKFYRDCHEQGVLGAERRVLLRKLFFESSSPLRTEADNWFLKELHGRYDAILKFVARHEGCSHGDIIEEIHRLSGGSRDQIGGYLKILGERYQLIEKKLPVFASPNARAGRYYITDNFIAAWLAALSNPVSSIQFRPIEAMVARADEQLEMVEGHALEKLVATIYEERSRKALPGFNLTDRVRGYWNSADTELDLVAIDDVKRIVRLATCKRSATRLVEDRQNFRGHGDRFLAAQSRFAKWTVEWYGIAPVLNDAEREQLSAAGIVPQDLGDLTRDLLPTNA